MAVYGIGTYYNKSISSDFIQQNLVGLGWDYQNEKELHEHFQSLKIGDIVYIKSDQSGSFVTVSAIGIIRDDRIICKNGLIATGRNVRWISTDEFIIHEEPKINNKDLETIHEELHYAVLNEIIMRIS